MRAACSHSSPQSSTLRPFPNILLQVHILSQDKNYFSAGLCIWGLLIYFPSTEKLRKNKRALVVR